MPLDMLCVPSPIKQEPMEWELSPQLMVKTYCWVKIPVTRELLDTFFPRLSGGNVVTPQSPGCESGGYGCRERTAINSRNPGFCCNLRPFGGSTWILNSLHYINSAIQGPFIVGLTDMPQVMRDVVFWNDRWKKELILYSIYNDTTRVCVRPLNSVHWIWAGHSDTDSKPNSSNIWQLFKVNFPEYFYQSVVWRLVVCLPAFCGQGCQESLTQPWHKL